MLDKNYVLGWEDVEHDLYQDGKYTFGVSLDLFNNHEVYYCKITDDGREYYYDLSDDIYQAIDQFNQMLEVNVEDLI